MQRYREFQPTGFDCKGLLGEHHGIDNWFVFPVSITRDTGCSVTLSNWRVALKELGGESDYVQVHRFGHWGPGWFEIILIKPTAKKTVAKAEDMERAMEDYPVLDEEDMSEQESDQQQESWEGWASGDFCDELTQKFPQFEDYLLDLPDDILYGLFRQAMESTNTYWEHDDSGAGVDIPRVVAGVSEDDIGDRVLADLAPKEQVETLFAV